MAVRRDALVRLLLLMVAARGTSGAKVPAMFVFGDSTADVWNNDYLPGSSARANFPHSGIDFPGGKPTGRFSNGLIGVDFLGQPPSFPVYICTFSMGFKKSPPPYLSLVANAASSSSSSEVTRNVTKAAASYMTGANLASGGSGILDSTGTTINMTKQIEYFSDLKDQMKTRLNANRVSVLLSKSIFLISAGGNDAFDFFSQNKSLDYTGVQQFTEAVISTYDSHVKTLYNFGARKFAVIDVPLIGCCPYWRSQNPTGECIEPIRDLFTNLRSEMQRMKYSIASSYELASSLIENPEVAGFEEVKSACCGGGRLNVEERCTPKSSCCSDRGKYLFWDLLHPTQATSKFEGLAFYDGLAQFVSPITFKQLVDA